MLPTSLDTLAVTPVVGCLGEVAESLQGFSSLVAGLSRYRVTAVVVLGWAGDWVVAAGVLLLQACAVAVGVLLLQALPVLLLQLLQIFLALAFLSRLLELLQVFLALAFL